MGKLEIHMQKKKTSFFLDFTYICYTTYKNKLKMDHTPNQKAKTIKFLQENIRATFHDLGFSYSFSNNFSKNFRTGKTDKLGFFRMKGHHLKSEKNSQKGENTCKSYL